MGNKMSVAKIELNLKKTFLISPGKHVVGTCKIGFNDQ